MRTWLRRNRWGVITLPLLLALIGLPEVNDLYHRYYTRRFVSAVEVDAGAQGGYGKGRVRLVQVIPFQPTTYDGKPVAVPAGYQFFRAGLAFDLDDPEALGGCKISLEDRQGRRFEPDPFELSRTSFHSGSCVAFPDPTKTFNSDVYFLLPPGAEPSAIRVELETLQPRFLRLHVA